MHLYSNISTLEIYEHNSSTHSQIIRGARLEFTNLVENRFIGFKQKSRQVNPDLEIPLQIIKIVL